MPKEKDLRNKTSFGLLASKVKNITGKGKFVWIEMTETLPFIIRIRGKVIQIENLLS